MSRPLIVVPTFNEAENLDPLVSRILRACPEARILIVDDASPDGTGRLADGLSIRLPGLSVLHRRQRGGIGPAYLDGFRRALAGDSDPIVTMDGDLSHEPESLPALLAADADVAAGSRYVPGGSIVNWGTRRRWLSRLGNRYARAVTRLPVADSTSGFQRFRRRVLETIDLDSIRSRGYAFQIEMKFRAWRAGFRIAEVPIRFVERRTGRSKMTWGTILEAVRIPWVLRRSPHPGPSGTPG